VCLLNGFIKNVDLVCFNVRINPLFMVTLRNTSVYEEVVWVVTSLIT